MGTVPNNFPPDAILEIGQILTGSATGRVATLATTKFFTAPVAGLYLLSAAIHIVTTDGTGTLVATVTLPDGSTVTEGGNASSTMQDADLSAGSDGFMAASPAYMSVGGTVQVGVVAAGLTGTEYNVFVSAQRLF